jgi:hypothetical protein
MSRAGIIVAVQNTRAVPLSVLPVLLVCAALASALATHACDVRRIRPFDVHALSATEMVETMRWLDQYYASPDGLRRPHGMVLDGHVDYEAVAFWLFQNYLQARSSGLSPDEARNAVAAAIRQTPEWRTAHQP